MSQTIIRLLLIEDDPDDATIFKKLFTQTEEIRYEIFHCEKIAEGIQYLEKNQSPDIILLDLFLPDSQGTETFAKIYQTSPLTPCVVLTGLPDKTLALELIRHGAQDFLIKGQIDRNALTKSVHYAIERGRLQAEIKALSLTDELTGLYNRRGFMTLAEQQRRLHLRHGREFILFFMDLDELKVINDTCGHLQGDELLKKFSGILGGTFRSSDIVARIGGDEFAAMALESPQTNVEIIIRRLCEKTKAAEQLGKDRLSFSFGYAFHLPNQTSSIEDLLKEADAMMYRGKSSKKASK